MGLQEAVATEPSGPADDGAGRFQEMSRETVEGSEAEFDEMPQDPGADRVLETLQEFGNGSFEHRPEQRVPAAMEGALLRRIETRSPSLRADSRETLRHPLYRFRIRSAR